jgi:ferredoxin
MTYVVTGNCKGIRDTSCVVVCPTQAFRLGEDMLYIDPNECIDCNACIFECPVDAIFPDHDLAGEELQWIEINKTMSKKSPLIKSKIKPLIQ